ncbi:MAG: glycosyltransferase [Casimicrobiaceae bacterium]
MPPFHQVNAVSTAQSRTETGAIQGLFVGRYAPNKGHEHLIKVACAARKILPVPLHVRMVGTRDAVLQGYLDWLDALIRELDVSDVVRLDGRLTEADLNVAFEEADVFVCMSEHEGFCVPIVEAQARGLPVVASACAAVVETAGANQAILPIPKIPTDYAWYARACLDAVRHQPFRRALTEAGYRNFYNRFAPDRIDVAFAEALVPVLQRHLS